MGNTSDHNSLLSRLKGKEKVTCTKCGRGSYNAKGPYDFYCDKCGDHIHIVPNVTVE